jgi:VWFA-related protein
MRRGAALAALGFALAAAASLAGQATVTPPGGEPPAAGPPPPVFGVGVDLVAVDVSVVDATGRPALGLGPDDFEVKVDGRPRPVVSAEYVGRELEPGTAAPPARAPSASFSTNEGEAPRGRLVLIVVDRENIGRGGGRTVVRAADRFLDSLAPADRAGVVFLPATGGQIEFTSDVQDVRRALKGVVGMASRSGYQVPLAEAVAYLKEHDEARWARFVDNECSVYRMAEQIEACRARLAGEAPQVLLLYRERSLMSQRALGAVFAGLRSIEGPKTVILVSEGLGTESSREARELAYAAAEAQATLFVVLVDTSGPDAAHQKTAFATSEDRRIETDGLYELAALARGMVLRTTGAAESAFQRIEREMMGYYVLGVEPEPQDRDGRRREVAVSVRRAGVTVRSRGVIAVPATAPSTEALLASALRSPVAQRGLPVRATAYALRDPASGRVRLLVRADVGRAEPPASVAYVLARPDGRAVTSRAFEGLAPRDGWVPLVAEAVVDPGSYTLRVAAVDARGRRGSVEHQVKAAPVSAGGLEISDLVLAPAGAGESVRPAVDLAVDRRGMTALLEVAASDPLRVAAAAVAFEVAESESGQALLRVPAPLGEAGKGGLRVARVTLGGGLLPPGDYVARASVAVDGRAVAALSRPFRVVPDAPGAPPAAAPLAGLLESPPAFDRGELLRPPALPALVDAALAAEPGPLPAEFATAAAEVRAGRPEAALEAAPAASREDARASFLRGVSFYARGNLPAALTQLQSALRLRPEMLPAAVYAGACYAASGRDLEAIGAWQTALLGDAATPVVYALLADALLRARETQQAIAILGEGLAAFPDDPALQRRLGMAHAAAGNRQEALPLLRSWVDEHPGDTGALFATLALLFDGFSRETAAPAAAEEDGRMLARYARAYVESGAPNHEVVERWVRYLESRRP